MDRYQADSIAHFKAQVGHKRDEINIYYAEIKIKLPTYLKTLTLKELRSAGGVFYPNIYLPKNAEDNLKSNADSSRKKVNLEDKLASLFEQRKNHIILHYRRIKQELPEEVLQTRLGDLEDKFVISKT